MPATTIPAGGYQGGAAQPQGGGPVAGQNWSPGAMDPMLQQLLQSVMQGTAGINNLNANPGANPLFQGQINPILQAMQPFLHDQQQTLQASQRANGNLGDTSSGVSMGNLLGQQATQMGGVAANQFNQAYNNSLAGYSAPATMAGNAAKSMPMYTQNYMQPQNGAGNAPNTYGTGQNAFLNGTSGFNAANDPYFQNALRQANPPPAAPPAPGAQGQGNGEPGAGTGGGTGTGGPSIWDILRNQSGTGGQSTGGSGFYMDPSTGTFSNQPSSQALYSNLFQGQTPDLTEMGW